MLRLLQGRFQTLFPPPAPRRRRVQPRQAQARETTLLLIRTLLRPKPPQPTPSHTASAAALLVIGASPVARSLPLWASATRSASRCCSVLRSIVPSLLVAAKAQASSAGGPRRANSYSAASRSRRTCCHRDCVRNFRCRFASICNRLLALLGNAFGCCLNAHRNMRPHPKNYAF